MRNGYGALSIVVRDETLLWLLLSTIDVNEHAQSNEPPQYSLKPR